jgi:hypothetical protein
MGRTVAFQGNGWQHHIQEEVAPYVGDRVRFRISFIVSVLNRSATLEVSTVDRISA